MLVDWLESRSLKVGFDYFTLKWKHQSTCKRIHQQTNRHINKAETQMIIKKHLFSLFFFRFINRSVEEQRSCQGKELSGGQSAEDTQEMKPETVSTPNTHEKTTGTESGLVGEGDEHDPDREQDSEMEEDAAEKKRYDEYESMMDRIGLDKTRKKTAISIAILSSKLEESLDVQTAWRGEDGSDESD